MNAKQQFDERLDAIQNGKTTTLDLSDLGLSSIPDEVFSLTRLTHLSAVVLPRISEPLLLSLETDIDGSPERGEWDVDKYLAIKRTLYNLREHYARQLPATLLTELPEAVANLVNLEVLNLSNQYLTYLPNALTTLPHLRKLQLMGNQITHLPPDFARLTSLQLLDLRKNPLEQGQSPEWTGLNWPHGFDQMPLQGFNERQDEAKRQKNLAVKAGDFERAAELRAEEVRWGLHL